MSDLSMRERLTRILHVRVEGGPIENPGQCKTCGAILDSLLTEMENPSEGVSRAGEVSVWEQTGLPPRMSRASAGEAWSGMLAAIKEGK